MGGLHVNKGAKIGIAAAATVVVAVGGYGAYNVATAIGDGSSDSAKAKPRTVVAEPPTAEQAAAGAKAFLEAWAKGDVAGAAALTDAPDQASTALTAFQDKVKPSAVHLTPGGPTAFPSASAAPSTSAAASAAPSAASAAASASPAAPAGVPLSFKASLEFADTGTPWNYDGVLGVVKMSDGKPAVHWTPSVIHPHLGPGETIAVKPVFATPAAVTDRNGKSLAAFPSVAQLLERFKTSAPQGSPQDAGAGVVITPDSGSGAPEKLFTVKDPKPVPSLKLTLDATLQQAAEAAVQEQSKGGTHAASIVAVEPSTGNILAFANAPATGQNRAFSGATAPGSTMKVVTSAALLEAGITPTTPVACPSSTMVTGLAVKNDFDDARPNNTFTDDFTQSCNTAFIEQGSKSLKADSLPKIAKDVFGLGLEWHTGLSNFDTKIPTEGNMAGAATEFIGQGKVQTNPLGMASVAATVQSGVFRQPILVPGSDQVKAARTLSPDVLQNLRNLMNQTAKVGTAKDVMAGITADAGAKTGTAEVAPGKATNSWFTAFRGNLAVAAEVEGGGHGADAAGPAAAKLLKIGNSG
ncbi:penicillin-binding transpeptidase domain-containing protein [Kitasatospora cinereorecta]|uniref:Penicillin-binding transpeptidase domain-containing protein n=1 Tax=Kitasatospora cinereorecta TaxID=285560 RepID=A0ABW0VGJ0_9ACTN